MRNKSLAVNGAGGPGMVISLAIRHIHDLVRTAVVIRSAFVAKVATSKSRNCPRSQLIEWGIIVLRNGLVVSRRISIVRCRVCAVHPVSSGQGSSDCDGRR